MMQKKICIYTHNISWFCAIRWFFVVYIKIFFCIISFPTVMRIIESNLFSVPVRFRQINMSSFSHHNLLYLRTLYIVWSLVRRRVTRRLTGLQTMHNVLKIAKHFKTVSVWLRLIFQFTYFQYCKTNSCDNLFHC